MEMLLQDLRFAVRVLRKNPGFTLVAFFTLALGIGATTAIFSVAYEALLRPLPYENPDQIVRLWEVNAREQRMNFTDPNFEDIRSQSHFLQGLAEYGAWPESVSGGSEPTRTMVATVGHDFFPLMRVRPVLGRGFAPDEQHFGAAPAALVSYSYWQQYLGSVSDLSAVKLNIENRAVSVIGVLPPGFRFPDDSTIWMPRELNQRLPSRSAHNWHVLGRLRDGIAPEQAQAELASIARQIHQQYGQDVDMTAHHFTAVVRSETDSASVIPSVRRIVRTLDPSVPPTFSTFTQVLSNSLKARGFNLTLVGVFAGAALLLAIAGLYGVMAYAVTQRTGEFGVRTALGSSPGNILRLVLGQGIVTALVGVSIGLAGALILTRTLQSLLFGLSPTDPLTFAVVALMLVVVAMLACYVPARRAARVDPMVALRYE